MHRLEFQRLSRLRLREARILLQAAAHEGAYYLLGYAVECALKACVAKRFCRHDIPDRKLVHDVYTHDFERLIDLAKLRQELQESRASQREFRFNWMAVVAWQEIARYNPRIMPPEARKLYHACVARKHGVLTWLRQRW